MNFIWKSNGKSAANVSLDIYSSEKSRGNDFYFIFGTVAIAFMFAEEDNASRFTNQIMNNKSETMPIAMAPILIWSLDFIKPDIAHLVAYLQIANCKGQTNYY